MFVETKIRIRSRSSKMKERRSDNLYLPIPGLRVRVSNMTERKVGFASANPREKKPDPKRKAEQEQLFGICL